MAVTLLFIFIFSLAVSISVSIPLKSFSSSNAVQEKHTTEVALSNSKEREHLLNKRQVFGDYEDWGGVPPIDPLGKKRSIKEPKSAGINHLLRTEKEA